MNKEIFDKPKVIISGDNVELSEAIKNWTEEKSQRLFNHSADIVRLRVILSKEKEHYIATGRVEIYGPDLVTEGKDEDLYKAVSNMVDLLDRQLRIKSRKEKHRIHK